MFWHQEFYLSERLSVFGLVTCCTLKGGTCYGGTFYGGCWCDNILNQLVLHICMYMCVYICVDKSEPLYIYRHFAIRLCVILTSTDPFTIVRTCFNSVFRPIRCAECNGAIHFPVSLLVLKTEGKTFTISKFLIIIHKPLHLLSELPSRAFLDLLDALNRMPPSISL